MSVALLGAFFARQARAADPLMPLGVFRSRNVSGANVIQMLMVAGLFGMFFLGVLYLQQLLGYDAIQTGLAFLPVAVLIGALSLFVTPRLNMRIGERATLLPGLALVAAGLAWFAGAPLHADYLTDVLPAVVLLGTGAGLSFPSLATLAMKGVAPGEAGLASGLINTSLQVGGALGLAVLATLSATRTETLLADGDATAQAVLGGYHLAFWIAAGFVVAAVAVAAVVLRPAPRAVPELDREFASELPAPALLEAG